MKSAHGMKKEPGAQQTQTLATNTLLGAKEHVQAIAQYFHPLLMQVRLQVLLNKEYERNFS